MTPDEIMPELSLGDYDSGHFVFGIDVRQIEGFDIMNNPFVQIIGGHWNVPNGWLDLEVDYCPTEYIRKLIGPY